MLSIVPPIFLFLSMSPQVTKKHFDSVKFILSGAAPIAESDVLKFYERFGADQDKLKFVQGTYQKRSYKNRHCNQRHSDNCIINIQIDFGQHIN